MNDTDQPETVLLRQDDSRGHYRRIITTGRAEVTNHQLGIVLTRTLPRWEALHPQHSAAALDELHYRMLCWEARIKDTIDHARTAGTTRAVYHGGPLDGHTHAIHTDQHGYPDRIRNAVKPPKIEILPQEDDTGVEMPDTVEYHRERYPAPDGLWHYHTQDPQ